jgi:hypothetical protein
MSRQSLPDLLGAARSSGTARVTLAGRAMRLWLARAEAAIVAVGDPVAISWTAGKLGALGEVLSSDQHRGLPWPERASTTALLGVPGRRYCHLRQVAGILLACRIERYATLAYSPGQLLLVGRRPPARDGRWVLRRLRGDGRLGVGALRAFGPVPTRLKLVVSRRFVELVVVPPVGVGAGDEGILQVLGPKGAPYVVLSGPAGRRARAELGARGAGTVVWVRAEVGRVSLMPADPAGALRRPR